MQPFYYIHVLVDSHTFLPWETMNTSTKLICVNFVSSWFSEIFLKKILMVKIWNINTYLAQRSHLFDKSKYVSLTPGAKKQFYTYLSNDLTPKMMILMGFFIKLQMRLLLLIQKDFFLKLNFTAHKFMHMRWKQLKRKKRYPINLLPHSSRREVGLHAFHKSSLWEVFWVVGLFSTILASSH